MRRSRNYGFDFFLTEMHTAMDRILLYTRGLTFEQFESNDLIKDAVIRNFEVIGESVRHVPYSYQRKHPFIPWKYMLSLRNFIVHEFFDVDIEIVWSIITTDLKQNQMDLSSLLVKHDGLKTNSSDAIDH